MQIKLTKTEKILLGMCISLLLLSLGGLSNMIVTEKNDCKMPFLADYNYESEDYFSFQLDKKPELWYLSDIIKVRNRILSIGDILAYQSVLVISILGFMFIYLKIKDEIKQKNQV